MLKVNDPPGLRLARRRRILRRRGRRRRGLQGRIDPARVDAPIEAIGGLGIDRIGVQNQAPERHLDMPARATEAVIEVEVAKCRVQIVAPKQADDAPAEPHAFRIAGRPAESALRFGKFIDFLGFLGAVLCTILGAVLGVVFGIVLGALFRRGGLLVGRLGVVVLAKSRRNGGRNSAGGCGCK